MTLRLRVIHDGPKNFALQVTGVAPFESKALLNVKDFHSRHGKVDSIAIDAVYYMVADGVSVLVLWDSGEERFPVLPLGGRGRIDFSEVRGLQDLSDGNGCGLAIEAKGEGAFTLILDLSKHMEV